MKNFSVLYPTHKLFIIPSYILEIKRLILKMIDNFVSRLWKMLILYQHEFIEIQNSSIALLWGIWFLVPIWNNVSMEYDYFQNLIPFYIWGFLGIGVGIYQLIAVVQQKKLHRRTACLLSFLFWLFVFSAFLTSGLQRIIIIFYLGLVFSNAFVYLRIRFVNP